MRIKRYAEFIKEQYQVGGSLPVFTYTGVNYGNGKDGVAGTFGGKTDPAFSKRTAMNTLDDNLVYSEHTGEYYSETDIRALLFKYYVYCKQNNEEPIEITDLSTKTLDYILRTMDSK